VYTLNHFYSIYGVNDDYLIDTMLKGLYNNSQSAYVTYIHSLLGNLLVVSYQLFPNVPIYSIILLLLFFIAIVGTYLVALNLNKSKFFLVSATWLTSSIFITNWYVLNPTFTTVSILLSSFGYLYIFSILKSKKGIKYLDFVFPLIILFLGYVIRSRGFQSSTLVWLPTLTGILLYRIYKKEINFPPRFKPKYLLIISPILLVFTSNLFIAQDWKSFYDYNNLRQEIANTTRTIYIQQNIEKSGWDPNELTIFDNYAFADQDKFDKRQLESLIEFSNSSQGVQGFLNPVVSVTDRLLNLMRLTGLILTFLILPIGMVIAKSRNHFSNYVYFLLIAGSTFFSLYYILATGKVEERVIIPVILNIWFIAFALPSRTTKKLDIFVFFVFIASSSLFLINFQSHLHEPTYFKERSKWNQRAITFSNQQQNFLEKLGPESVFVGPSSSFRSNWSSPYEPLAKQNVNFVSLGWHNFSPSWNSHNKEIFNNDLTVYQNLMKNPDVYWISDPDSSEYFFNYLKKNYNDKLSPVIIDSFGDETNDYGGIYNVYSLLIK
jgi:hypothetical protein